MRQLLGKEPRTVQGLVAWNRSSLGFDEGLTLASYSVCSVAVCRFSNTGEDWYVLVGVAKDLILNPRSVAGGFVYTYKLVNNGEKLEFLHKVGISQ